MGYRFGHASNLPKTPAYWIAALMLVASTGFVAFVPAQSDFSRIALGYLPGFAAYGYLLLRGENGPVHFFLGVALLARLILLFSFPNLSDDVYRFIWDGRLTVQGYNPFDQLPAYYLQSGNAVRGLSEVLFRQLNSPEYFTIYPPLAQATFALAAWLFPGSLTGSSVVMKLFLLACEAGTLWLLPKMLRDFGLPLHRSLLYALNPLIIVEVMGNLHYEGAMIFFFLLGWWWLRRGRMYLGGVAIALSIATKLLPLLFLPFFIRRLGWSRSLRFFGVLGIVLLLLFFPLINGVFIKNFGSSLDLYFRKFEFNASVYYLFRWLGYLQKGYNQIARFGPMLAMATFIGITTLALWSKNRDWASLGRPALFAICLYLFCTTTVHPWYVATPLVLCGFTTWRFPVLWSVLIPLTYINYSYPEYRENLWIVALEYGLTFAFLLYEAYRLPKAPNTEHRAPSPEHREP